MTPLASSFLAGIRATSTGAVAGVGARATRTTSPKSLVPAGIRMGRVRRWAYKTTLRTKERYISASALPDSRSANTQPNRHLPPISTRHSNLRLKARNPTNPMEAAENHPFHMVLGMHMLSPRQHRQLGRQLVGAKPLIPIPLATLGLALPRRQTGSLGMISLIGSVERAEMRRNLKLMTRLWIRLPVTKESRFCLVSSELTPQEPWA